MSETYDTQTYVQYGQYMEYYINGFGLSNDATTPNSILDIAAGSCMDSTGTFQLSSNVVIKVNSAVNGLNGLDTGTVAASTVYPVYLVWDPVSFQPTGAMISLSYTQPLMPFGYNSFLLIGYVVTDSSSHFLKGYWTAGNGTMRSFFYDAPQATAVTAGAATTYTAVDLTKWVPNLNNTPIWIASAFTPGAASRTLKMQPVNATGDAIIITGQVTSVVVTSNSFLLAQVASAKPEINYVVSNAGDAAALNVAGYQWFV
jgi:hypothetical protein